MFTSNNIMEAFLCLTQPSKTPFRWPSNSNWSLRRGRVNELVLRWILHSARNPAGEIVRLEAVRLGSRWMTSREALQRFAEQLTPKRRTRRPQDAHVRAQRQRVERAGRKLRKNRRLR